MNSTLAADMFVLGLPIAEKILRPIVVYVFLIVGLRLAGKRELAQLNPFDLVVLLTLSNTVQNAIIGDDNSVTGGLIGAATLLIVNHVVVRFLYRHERLDRLIEGDPDVLIENGVIRIDRLKDEAHHARRARRRGAQAGLRVARRDRSRDSRARRQHLLLRRRSRRRTPSRHEEILARLDRSVGAAGRAAGLARMTGPSPGESRSRPSATPRAALSAMRGAAIRTPLVRVELPARATTPRDLELYLKLEILQPIGSFKIRGAYNVVRQLSPDELARRRLDGQRRQRRAGRRVRRAAGRARAAR